MEARSSGPTRVLGGAGTGKTVVAMHRAVHLVTKALTRPEDRLLFTTFTRNLALDLKRQLETLMSPAAFARLDVLHIDRLAVELLREAGHHVTVCYWDAPDGRLQAAWREAMRHRVEDNGLDDRFYREEWTTVVSPQECRTWDAYRDAHRAGRGVRVSRHQRRAAWEVFAAYRDALDRLGIREPEGALYDVASLLQSGALRRRYRAIVVDEAQDMGTAAFGLLRALAPEGPDDLFIVGDGHQRIYQRRTALKDAGIQIVGRSHRLRINYRTTEEIRRFAVGLLEGRRADELDGSEDNQRGYRSLTRGERPVVQAHGSFEDEVEAVAQWLRSTPERERACVVARTQAARDAFADALVRRGFTIRMLSRDQVNEAAPPGVRLATMHRVKGLEFDRVALVDCGDRRHSGAAAAEPEEPALREDALDRDRALLYVALTRARRNVLITGVGPTLGVVP